MPRRSPRPTASSTRSGRPTTLERRCARCTRTSVRGFPAAWASRRARVSERPTPVGVLAAEDGRLYFGTTPGTLELLRVQPPGRRAMDAASYLRGHAV